MYAHFEVRTINEAVITLRSINGNVISRDDYTTFPELDTLVIINDGFYSLQLPQIFLTYKDFISKFKKVIWFTPGEAHPKILDRTLYREASTLPVFETIFAFSLAFPNAKIKFFDADFETNKDYLRWLRFNKIHDLPFEADFWYGNKGALSTVSPLCDYFQVTDVELVTKTLPNFIQNRQRSKLYWCLNWKRRWGKVLAVYLLYKNNLLEDGNVTLYSPFITNRFIKVMDTFGLKIDDLGEFNKLLPMKHEYAKDEVPDNYAYFKSPVETVLDCPINLTTETHFFERNRTFTEKTVKPLLFGQIILPFASQGVYHSLSEIFDYRFSPATYDIDKIIDPIQRANKAIEYVKRFKESKSDLDTEQNIVIDNYNHNMNVMMEHRKQNEFEFIKKVIQTWI